MGSKTPQTMSHNHTRRITIQYTFQNKPQFDPQGSLHVFILTPMAIHSSLTSKQAHMCSPVVIAASLVVPRVFSILSSSFFAKVSKR